MKKSIFLVSVILLLGSELLSQVNLKDIDFDKMYIIYTNDKNEFVGKIISVDKKEVVINSIKLGEISIPTYQIKEIKEAKTEDISASGDIIYDNIFATRYFITTNGLDIKKGDSYVLFNWYGPDIQFGISDNWTVGIMTTWLATPVVGTVKYSTKLNDNTSMAFGVLIGTLGWSGWNTGGALPYAAITFGDRKNNLSISAGYGAIRYTEFDYTLMDDVSTTSGEALISLAGMKRINNKLSFVFDSFIIPRLGDGTPTALLIPGLRIQRKEGFALQFGLSGVYTGLGDDSEGYFFAMPMIQLYWKF